MNALPQSRVRPGRILKKVLLAPFVVIAAIIILIEDWLWEDLARVAAFLGRLPLLRSMESLIVSLPPYLALLVFAVPTLLLVPVKLLAVYFITHGQATFGFLTVVAAKVFGTALVARIFILTRPKLMRIRWFAWAYSGFVIFKAHVYTYLKSTAIYRVVHEQHLRIREAVRTWFSGRRSSWRRRWIALVKLIRRRKQKPA